LEEHDKKDFGEKFRKYVLENQSLEVLVYSLINILK